MTAVPVSCVDGPFDGADLHVDLPSSTSSFVWTDGQRVFQKPGRGRALYKVLGSTARFAGFRFALCVCGTYRLRRTQRCGLCGSKETVA